jgi:hypothetical protein
MNTTQETCAAVLAKMGVTLESSSGLVGVREKDWECVTFQCSLSRRGKVFWSGPYHLGLGHVKLPKVFPFMNFSMDEARIGETLVRKPNVKFLPEGQEIKVRLYQKLVRMQKVFPSLLDVMHSLLSDGSAQFDSQAFEDWCGDLGYDTDSRKAHETWLACVEIGMCLRRAFSAAEVEELREAFSQY